MIFVAKILFNLEFILWERFCGSWIVMQAVGKGMGTFRGGSCIVDPSSKIVKSASFGENAVEVIETQIDEDTVIKWRLDLPLLRDVRPEIAGLAEGAAAEIYLPKKR